MDIIQTISSPFAMLGKTILNMAGIRTQPQVQPRYTYQDPNTQYPPPVNQYTPALSAKQELINRNYPDAQTLSDERASAIWVSVQRQEKASQAKIAGEQDYARMVKNRKLTANANHANFSNSVDPYLRELERRENIKNEPMSFPVVFA